MKTLLIGFFLFTMLALHAQEENIVAKLENAGISIAQLENSLKDGDAKFYFKSTITALIVIEGQPDSTLTQISEFDPRRKIGERWKLLSINADEPTEEATKTFNKAYNSTKDINGKIDQSTLSLIGEDDLNLVIGFRYKKSSLPKKYKVLKDCDATYTINKQEQRLEKALIKNFRPTKMFLVKVPEFSMEMNFLYLDEAEGYHIKTEEMDMTIQIFGIEAISKSNIEYSDFKKVK